MVYPALLNAAFMQIMWTIGSADLYSPLDPFQIFIRRL